MRYSQIKPTTGAGFITGLITFNDVFHDTAGFLREYSSPWDNFNM